MTMWRESQLSTRMHIAFVVHIKIVIKYIKLTNNNINNNTFALSFFNCPLKVVVLLVKVLESR